MKNTKKRLGITIEITEDIRQQLIELRQMSKKPIAQLFRESIAFCHQYYSMQGNQAPEASKVQTPPPLPAESKDESETMLIRIETNYPPAINRKDISHE